MKDSTRRLFPYVFLYTAGVYVHINGSTDNILAPLFICINLVC